jgi:hypothetical protein
VKTRAEFARNSLNLVAFAVLLPLAVYQYTKIAGLEGRVDAKNAEIETLQRSDFAQKEQLADFAKASLAQKELLADFVKAGLVQKELLADFARASLAQKQQLADFERSNETLKTQVEDLDRRQKADEAKTRAINFIAIKGSHGQNVFVGPNAGSQQEPLENGVGDNNPNVGSFNSALGHDALGANRTGAMNAAVGTAALGLNEGGSNNVAAGANALGSNKSGAANVAVGSAAMYRNVSGTHNSAVGLQALYNLETGNNNSAFGRDALFSMKNGSWNSAYGVDALPGLEVGEGNSAFGGEAGYTEIRDNQHRLGSYNSWFGYQSGPATLKQVSNSIAIGYQAKNTDSNQTVIGNKNTAEAVIYGDVKVSTLCIGTICADAAAFGAMLKANKKSRVESR